MTSNSHIHKIILFMTVIHIYQLGTKVVEGSNAKMVPPGHIISMFNN